MLRKNVFFASSALMFCLVGCGPVDEPAVDCDDAAPQSLSGTISDDQTLELQTPVGCVDYYVTGNLTIRAGVSVEPGVIFEFAESAALSVREGFFAAEGTEDLPIIFTGELKVPGSWRGIHVWHASLGNSFDHVVIEYGGGGNNWNHMSTHGSLVLNHITVGETVLAFTNSTIRHSADAGFVLTGSARFQRFGGNTFTENADVPGRISVTAVGSLNDSGTSTYSGNGIDRLHIYGTLVETTQTWEKLDVPYYAQDNFHIGRDNTATLTIEPGATLVFSENTGISARNNGILRAIGTEAEPITFTGEVAQAGSWLGVQIWSGSLQNALEHVVIEYGGSAPRNYLDPGSEANLVVSSATYGWDAYVVLNNAVLRGSGNKDIHVHSGTVEGCENVSLEVDVDCP